MIKYTVYTAQPTTLHMYMQYVSVSRGTTIA